MGLASAQASFALAERSYTDRMTATRGLAISAIGTAIRQIDAINTRLVPPLDGATLKSLHAKQATAVLRHREGPTGPTVGYSENEFVGSLNPNLYDTIVAVRSSITAKLTQANRGGTRLVNAFNLGVNMAIAEAQATGGSGAKRVVIAALSEARTNASALTLNLAALDECIDVANTTTPLRDVHTRILAVRSTYQTLLGN
jgi:hypothetical protein